MNGASRIVICTIALAAPETLVAQVPPAQDKLPQGNTMSIGYNTFGEFYLGAEFPRRSRTKLSLQAGYQVAITSDMSYTWGPFATTTPWLTNNCKGVRFRVGYQFMDNRDKNRISLFVETHQLESNPFIDQDYVGSSSVPAFYFTETHQKYGVRFQNASPLDKGHSMFFTVSVGIFYTMAHRTYLSASNGIPLPPDSDTTFTTPQISIGLLFLLF